MHCSRKERDDRAGYAQEPHDHSGAAARRIGVGAGVAPAVPGFSVYLKAGASGEQPRVEVAPDGHYRLNLDKGNQATGGPAATVAGNISNGSSNCSGNAPFQVIERLHCHTFPVTASNDGLLWLLVGTDSGFEGKTSLYYISITATLTPL